MDLGLPARALWPTPVKYAGEGLTTTAGYVSVGSAGMLIGFIKSNNPHISFQTSELLVMGGEAGRNAELARLDQQTNLFFIKRVKRLPNELSKRVLEVRLQDLLGMRLLPKRALAML